MQVEAKCQQVQERAERREQELSSRVSSLEEAGIQTDNQVKELKETIFELEDQVEQQRAVNLHTNQTVLDMESMFFSLADKFPVALWSLKLCVNLCEINQCLKHKTFKSVSTLSHFLWRSRLPVI